ncbi:hypothetical protein N9N67_05615 [Bacteriovoracaceae bacterium]|nr:hypothetical protein [Bacteriovoracaceae bacterium]
MTLSLQSCFLFSLFFSISIFSSPRFCGNEEIRKNILIRASLSEENFQNFSEVEKVLTLKSCFFGFKLFKATSSLQKYDKLKELKELEAYKIKKLKRLKIEKIVSIACENRISGFQGALKKDSSFLQRICENAYLYSSTN